MTDKEDKKVMDDHAELHDKISFDDSALQQCTTNKNDIQQVDEVINLPSTTVDNPQHYDEGLLRSEDVPEKETNAVSLQLGFPFTDLAEATSIHINSILRNQNTISEANNSYSQKPLFTSSDFKASYEIGVQQPIPFEFENYANQILGQKQIQPFVTANSNIAVEKTNDQVVDAFALYQIADKSEDQQTMNDEIINIFEPVKNFSQQLQIQKQANFETLHDKKSSRRSEAEITDNMLNKNSGNWDSEYQQPDIMEQVPLVQDGPAKNSTGEKSLEKLNFSESDHTNEPTKSLIPEYDLQNINPEVLEEMKSGKEFILPSGEKRSEQTSINMKAIEVAENPENMNEIQDKHPEQNESENVHEQAFNVMSVRHEENMETSSKCIEMFSEERNKTVHEADTMFHESKTVMEEDKKSDSISNISDCKREMNKQEADENIAGNNGIIKVKCAEFSGFKYKQKKKNDKIIKNELKNIKENASNNVTKHKSTKKPLSTITTVTVPTSKDVTKNNQMITMKKLMTKSALTSPLLSAKSAILEKKTVGQIGLKQTTNVANSNNIKIQRENKKLTKMPNVTSKLIQKTLQQRVITKSKISDKMNAMKFQSKDSIIKDCEKNRNEMRNDTNELGEKKRKIGAINFEPLIWTETLMPVYEQIWENLEIATKISDKSNVVFEREMEKKTENEMKMKNDHSGTEWAMRDSSKFMINEIVKSVNLSNGNETSVPQHSLNENGKDFILDISDSLKIRKDEKVTVEEKIVADGSSGKREIEIPASISIKPCETKEMKYQIYLEQKTLETMAGQDIGADSNKNSDDFHENINECMVPRLKSHSTEAGNETEAAVDEEVGIQDMVEKTEGIIENDGKIVPSEMEKSEIKLERNIYDKELEKTEKKAAVLAGSGSEQKIQSELETNDVCKYNETDTMSKKHCQGKDQFGRTYSDTPEECMHNISGKDSSRKHKQIDAKRNYSQQAHNGISSNVELQGNYQQQQNGHQDHPSKKQQQSVDHSNGEYYQNSSGRQENRKQNKRNKKLRNFQQLS